LEDPAPVKGHHSCVIGEEIRKARLAAKLSQEELGFKAHLSRNYISMIELNQSSPTLETLMRICRNLGVRASDAVAAVEREMEQRARPLLSADRLNAVLGNDSIY
jgi:transcriptional regulator with XRE-family HTH domain